MLHKAGPHVNYRDSSHNDDDSGESIVWVRPGTQYGCTDSLALVVAEEIVQGATVIAAAAKYGIGRSKLVGWLQRGKDADDEGAGPEHRDQPYHNFYLHVLQAQGIAAVRAQQAAFKYHTQWWLQNHPEARVEFGGEAGSQLLLAPPEPTAEAQVVVESHAPDEPTMRAVLRTMIESGMAANPGESEPTPEQTIVDAEFTIPDEDEHTEGQVG